VGGERARVLHVITRLILGGAQENTLLTVEHLDHARYRVGLASGPTAGPEGSLEGRIPADVAFVRIPDLVRDPHVIRDTRALHHLSAVMRHGDYQIVHTHTTKAGILGRIAARLARVPIVVHTPHGHAFHGYLNRAGSEALRRIERWLARRTDRIICLTAAERQEHVDFGICHPQQIEVIHSGVDIARFGRAADDPIGRRRALGLPAHGPLVGCVARLVPVKGVRHLLEAAPALSAAVPGSRVVFVGGGPLRAEMEQRARALNLDGAVVFLGLRDDVAELMPLFDVVVLPSLNEGMGRAAVEAMAAGRPVVGSRVSGIQDVVTNDVSGILVPPAEPREIATAVLRILRDPALAGRLSAGARHRARSYSVEAMMAKIHALYHDLLGARHRAVVSHQRRSGSRRPLFT
jgi:glycosyltransferase involved in cell wall biosynthesis